VSARAALTDSVFHRGYRLRAGRVVVKGVEGGIERLGPGRAVVPDVDEGGDEVLDRNDAG
jgi:hypothetical protein